MGAAEMTHNRRLKLGLTAALITLLVGGVAFVVQQKFFGPKSVTAYFASTTAIYPGDEVRVVGVKVGRIASIQPVGTQSKVTLDIDRHVPIPADAKAVIVAQNLVSARYIQLTPAYQLGGGPTMPSGAVIPIDRTAVPVEWDAVREQLMRLATDLGPRADAQSPAAARFIDSAADAMGGNGEKLRQTIAQLSGVGRILADGSGNIVEIVNNLQTFVTALSGSGEQIVQFQDRLATLSSVIDSNRTSLDLALTDLSNAVVDVKRFVAATRDDTSEQIQHLANVTQNLADHHTDIEQLLHATPTAIANLYNIYNPDTGAQAATFALSNFANPVQVICGMVAAVKNSTGPETAKLCAQYLGPALRLMNFNNLPFSFNPFLAPSVSPDKIIYSEDRLAPGHEGSPPSPADIPPAVSAYTGEPAADPGSPPPSAPPTLEDILLPAERPTP
jgi:phospholipid/cholesterol/gamma-HCH transport system substrate-binding protein